MAYELMYNVLKLLYLAAFMHGPYKSLYRRLIYSNLGIPRLQSWWPLHQHHRYLHIPKGHHLNQLVRYNTFKISVQLGLKKALWSDQSRQRFGRDCVTVSHRLKTSNSVSSRAEEGWLLKICGDWQCMNPSAPISFIRTPAKSPSLLHQTAFFMKSFFAPFPFPICLKLATGKT